jgi:predicted metal-dependent phosphoesterase TrpH
MGIADLHIHTTYSFDGTASVREVLESAASVGLDVIAVTDHDEVRGGLEASQLAGEYGLHAIPGAEISTTDGHLVALFIEEPVSSGLPLVDTLLRVGEKGGIGIAAHPDHPVPNSLPLQSILLALEHPQASELLQGVEICNMNPAHAFFNKRSERAAASLPLARIATSDAHLAEMVGAGVTHFDGASPDDLKRAIAHCTTRPERVAKVPALQYFLRWARLYHRRRKNWSSPKPGSELQTRQKSPPR